MHSFLCVLITALIAVFQHAIAISLDVNSPGKSGLWRACKTHANNFVADSIKDASSTLAYGLMSWYSNNQTDTEATKVGTLPEPLYWWEAGAVWGGIINYW